jgi:hypothetical protein
LAIGKEFSRPRRRIVDATGDITKPEDSIPTFPFSRRGFGREEGRRYFRGGRGSLMDRTAGLWTLSDRKRGP